MSHMSALNLTDLQKELIQKVCKIKNEHLYKNNKIYILEYELKNCLEFQKECKKLSIQLC